MQLSQFLDKTEPDTAGGCWLWTGMLNKSGYGSVWHEKSMRLAHRVSWTFHCGDIPAGLFVLHRCDVRACVNPAHLFLGTNADNMDDMKAKGRSRKTPEHCQKIRAARLGKSPSSVTRERQRIAMKRVWLTAEHREKVVGALVGRRHSPETIEKMRRAALGRGRREQK